VEVRVKGPAQDGSPRYARSLPAGLHIVGIRDVTPIPHNGCRPPKRRRVERASTAMMARATEEMLSHKDFLKGLEGEQEVGKTSKAVCACAPEGQKRFLKVCVFHGKCAIEKRNFIGQHGQSRPPNSSGLRPAVAREQKVNARTGCWSASPQFFRKRGHSGSDRLKTCHQLERRLDNVIRRAASPARMRKLAIYLHGHVPRKWRKREHPSYLVKAGTKWHEGQHGRNVMVMEARNVAQSQNTVPWLEINRVKLKAKVVPCRSARRADPAFNEQLIVGLSRKTIPVKGRAFAGRFAAK